MSDIALIKFREYPASESDSNGMPSILHIDIPSSNEGFQQEPKCPLPDDKDRASVPATQSLSSEDFCTDFGLHLAAREGAVETIISKLGPGQDTLRIIDLKDADGLAPLHHAAKCNQKEAASVLLEHDAFIDIAGEDCNTPLHIAAKYNCIDVARLLVSRGASVNQQNVYGSTALHFATRRGNTEIACLLIDHPGVDIKLKDNAAVTPLHQTAVNGNVQVLKKLLQNGADIHVTDNEGENALHFAASEDSDDVIDEILSSLNNDSTDGTGGGSKIKYVNGKSNAKDTALHLACTAGYENSVKKLIAHGANVNVEAEDRIRPLHLAAISGNIEVANELLCHRAKINAKDIDQMTPLHKAAIFGRVEMMKFLVDKGAIINARDKDNYTPILCTVWKGKTEAAKLLIDEGAKIHITDSTMKSCLHLAVECDHPETLTMLMENGAVSMINATDKDYRTPLHHGALLGNIEAINILLDNKAKSDMGDFEEKTPLHHAAENGKPVCVDLLAKADHACLNLTDDKGRMPLHLAAMYGHIRAIRILIDAGAEIDARDDTNWTPLDYAAKNGFFKSMRILLDNDAPVDARDKNNNTPLHWAAANGHVDCVTLLLDNGADIALKDVHGKNCLDCAVENNQQSICMALVKHHRWREVVDNVKEDGSSPMKKLIQAAPDVAEIVMNMCIEESQHPRNHKDFTITYDFRYIDLHPSIKTASQTCLEPVTMAACNREALLSHPLTKRLISHKWASLGRPVYYATLMTYLFFVACVTSTVVIEREGDRNKQLDKAGKGSYKSSSSLASSTAFKTVIPWLTVIICGFNLLKEIFQMILQKKKYFVQGINYLEWALYISTLVLMMPFILGSSNSVSFELKWTAGAISVLFTWINLLLFLSRFPYFGLYVVMFVEVLKTVIRVLLVFAIFIVGFALSFFVLLREQETFSTVGRALVKVAVMTIGELEFDTAFTGNINQKSPTTGLKMFPFEAVTYIIFTGFLLLMPIILMNLLVGLAVGDIEAVRKTAFIRILKQQVDILHDMENNYPSFIWKRAYTGKLVVFPNQLSCFQRLRSALGYNDEYGYLQEEQGEQAGLEAKLRDELSKHHKELIKQKKYVKNLTNLVQEQSHLLRQVAKKLNIREQDDE